MPRHPTRWPIWLCAMLLILAVPTLLIVACSPPPPSAGQRYSTQPAAMAQPTSAPAPANPPADEKGPALPTAAPGAAGQASSAARLSSAGPDRMIIKSAEVDLLVTDTDAAVDQVLGVVSDVGGYVLNMVTWQEGSAKLAKVTMRMPFDRYEEALRRLRRIGSVQKESSSGEDVSDEYVDLQAQQRNLEATAERLRSFLAKAETVDQALKVDQSLRAIEGEIEQVKGRLNYLSDRAAFSTITVYIQPERPTPTPAPTLTPTPTPTPVVWNPLSTAGRAGRALVDIYQVIVDLSLWLIIVVVPVFGLPAAVVWWFGWERKKWRPKSGTRNGSSPVATTDPTSGAS